MIKKVYCNPEFTRVECCTKQRFVDTAIVFVFIFAPGGAIVSKGGKKSACTCVKKALCHTHIQIKMAKKINPNPYKVLYC